MADVTNGFVRFNGKLYGTWNGMSGKEPRDKRFNKILVSDALSKGHSNIPSSILGLDGRPYQDGVIRTSKYGGGLSKADRKSKVGLNRDRGYPFIDFNDLRKNWYKIPYHYTMTKILRPLQTPSGERESLPSILYGGLVDALLTNNEQKLNVELRDSFPKIRVWQDFANSPSKIQEIYTVEWGSKELPIHLRAIGGPEATNEELKKGITFVRDKKTVDNYTQSPYNEVRGDYHITDFERKSFTDMAADKYTRGDFGTFIDPARFNPWFIKDDTWYIQQKGQIKTQEKKINVDGTDYTVRSYERPNRLNMWWYWFVGDQIYDAIDVWFDPIQRLAEKLLTEEAQQTFVREEYKMIAGIRRSVFDSPGRYDLAYELKAA